MSVVAWHVQDDEFSVICFGETDHDARVEFLTRICGLSEKAANADKWALDELEVHRESMFDKYAPGPILNTSVYLENGYSVVCPVCDSLVHPSKDRARSVKCFENMRDALAELVRLKDLKEIDPAAHNAGKDAAWDAARATLAEWKEVENYEQDSVEGRSA